LYSLARESSAHLATVELTAAVALLPCASVPMLVVFVNNGSSGGLLAVFMQKENQEKRRARVDESMN
jgi:hypothetical protein